MSDYLGRLVDRTLGRASVVEPLIASLYAPDPRHPGAPAPLAFDTWESAAEVEAAPRPHDTRAEAAPRPPDPFRAPPLSPPAEPEHAALAIEMGAPAPPVEAPAAPWPMPAVEMGAPMSPIEAPAAPRPVPAREPGASLSRLEARAASIVAQRAPAARQAAPPALSAPAGAPRPSSAGVTPAERIPLAGDAAGDPGREGSQGGGETGRERSDLSLSSPSPRLPVSPLLSPLSPRRDVGYATPALVPTSVHEVAASFGTPPARDSAQTPLPQTISTAMGDPGRAGAVTPLTPLPELAAPRRAPDAPAPPAVAWPAVSPQPPLGARDAATAGPTIKVSIGRIEVRAVPPPAPARPAPERPRAPALTLSEYLKQQGGRS